MRFIAKVPCNFGGKKYYPGNEVPEEAVLSPATQISMGVLDEVPNAMFEALEGVLDTSTPDVQVVFVPVLTGDNLVESVPMPAQSVTEAIRLMQLPKEQAVKELAEVDDPNEITIILLCSGNKAVLAAARKRKEELVAGGKEDGEAPEGERAGDA